jgi:TRAP-type C4-dicarboxylate transport system substrate-binding protein
MAARGQAVARAARRAWPVVLMAWERWQALTPAEKERYKKRAREATDRGRRAIEKQRRGRR